MNNKQKELLLKIREMQFALLECGLFLDTHKDSTEALEKLREYGSKAEALKKEYETEYGPLTLSTDFGDGGFDWINDPWPWEKEAN